MKSWRNWSKRRISLVVIALVSAFGIIALTWANAPYDEGFSFCYLCGISKTYYVKFPLARQEKVKANDVSMWVKSIYPEHNEHIFKDVNKRYRSSFFGEVGHDYRAFPAVWHIKDLCDSGGEEKAKLLLADYFTGHKLSLEEITVLERITMDKIKDPCGLYYGTW